MLAFPGPSEHDIEAVQDALEVARTQWLRGERMEALRWLRRAIDAAFDQGDDRRGLSLSKAASELQGMLVPAPPLPTQRLTAPSPSAPPAAPPQRASVPPRPRLASMAPPELPSGHTPPVSPGMRPPARIPMPTPSSGASLGSAAPPRPLRGPVPAVGVPSSAPPPPPPAGPSRGSVRLPLPTANQAAPTGTMRPPPVAPPAPAPRPSAPEPSTQRRNTRSTRRNTRVNPGEASRPTAKGPRVESSAGGAPSVLRAETDMPTLQGQRSPLVDGDTSVIPMPDVAAMAAAHAAKAVSERTAPCVPAVVAVLTQSVRVAVGPGPTLRLLPASEGLRPGEFEAWLTATSPAVDVTASLRTKRG